MITTVRGAFNDVEGELLVDADDPSRSEATLTVRASSVDTRNAKRDEHLRSADFFDVDRWPDITFVSRKIEEIDEGSYAVTGDLTIRDVTQEVMVPISLVGVETDAFGVLRAGFEGSRRLRRRDFGLEWNMPLDSGGVLVSERITLEFEISVIKTE
ncbi:polyisoprenoid-binding protein YceI [Pseudoclavibacter sp. JAI123]|nr:polyisoprenoid-binding protein YceI [Pseudoclavibacter sp. JAI123]